MIMVRFGLVASMVLKNAIHAKRAHTVYKQWPFYSIDREMADFLILISFPTFPNENKLIGLIVCVCVAHSLWFSRYLFEFWSTEMVMMFLGAWTKTMKLNIFMQSNLFHQINMDIYECHMCINNTLFSGCFVLSACLTVCVIFFRVLASVCNSEFCLCFRVAGLVDEFDLLVQLCV